MKELFLEILKNPSAIIFINSIDIDQKDLRTYVNSYFDNIPLNESMDIENLIDSLIYNRTYDILEKHKNSDVLRYINKDTAFILNHYATFCDRKVCFYMQELIEDYKIDQIKNKYQKDYYLNSLNVIVNQLENYLKTNKINSTNG